MANYSLENRFDYIGKIVNIIRRKIFNNKQLSNLK